MSAGKRGNSSRYSSSGNTGKDAARNVGIVLGLGGLSFFLGFFVLSRMVPDRHEEGVPSTATRASSQSVTPAPQTTQITVPIAASTQREPMPAATLPKKAASSDVTIEPADDISAQKPASIDKTADKDAGDVADKMDKLDAAPDATLDTPPKNGDSTGDAEPRAKRSGGTAAKVPAHTLDGDTPTVPTPPRPKRRTRTHSAASSAVASADSTDSTDNGGIVEGDQKPSRIDRDQNDAQPSETRAARRTKPEPKTEPSDSADEPAAKPARPARRSRYRVAAGSYALRESAERAVGRVTDLGLEATVVPVTREDGTTVYRVQQGVYRSRANAESARQKLSDAGLDAEVVKTGG